MILKEWEQLPKYMQNSSVSQYYKILEKKKASLIGKRFFDIMIACICLVFLFLPMIVISVMIKKDSLGPILFRQNRITQYGRRFSIFKFRTMTASREQAGIQITTNQDSRVTKIGQTLRKYRLDELPQLLNIIKGEMTFVGTRPEVEKYVKEYTDEMYATLLLPAGVTSEASIQYKEEEKLLQDCQNAERIYISQVLPEKMKYNLKALEKFGFCKDIITMIKTIVVVAKNE